MSEKKTFNAYEALKDHDFSDIRESAIDRQMFTAPVSAKYTAQEWQEYDKAKERCKNNWREWDKVKKMNPKFEQIAKDYKEALDAFDRYCEAHEK